MIQVHQLGSEEKLIQIIPHRSDQGQLDWDSWVRAMPPAQGTARKLILVARKKMNPAIMHILISEYVYMYIYKYIYIYIFIYIDRSIYLVAHISGIQDPKQSPEEVIGRSGQSGLQRQQCRP